eukprot:1841599-Prymnesium_polylepis.1
MRGGHLQRLAVEGEHDVADAQHVVKLGEAAARDLHGRVGVVEGKAEPLDRVARHLLHVAQLG